MEIMISCTKKEREGLLDAFTSSADFCDALKLDCQQTPRVGDCRACMRSAIQWEIMKDKDALKDKRIKKGDTLWHIYYDDTSNEFVLLNQSVLGIKKGKLVLDSTGCLYTPEWDAFDFTDEGEARTALEKLNKEHKEAAA